MTFSFSTEIKIKMVLISSNEQIKLSNTLAYPSAGKRKLLATFITNDMLLKER